MRSLSKFRRFPPAFWGIHALLLFVLAGSFGSSSATAQEEGSHRPTAVTGPVRPIDSHPGPEPIGTPVPIPRLDVLFLLDSTGSMGDEIQVVKDKMIDMIGEIESGDPRPEVRFAVLTYRDRGDEYITLAHDFSVDTDACVEFIQRISANGGGDGPESVNQALHEAIHDMAWDAREHVDRMIFLIGDAQPNIYPGDFKWENEIEEALDRDIIVHAIGCSGLGEEGVGVFREIAYGTEGTFEYLTYRTQVVDDAGESRELLYSGGRTYAVREEMKDEISDEDWCLGTDKLAEMGVLEEYPEALEELPAGPAGSRRGPDAGLPASAAKRNNLDSILTSKIKEKLAKKGVTYVDEDGDGEEESGDGKAESDARDSDSGDDGDAEDSEKE